MPIKSKTVLIVDDMRMTRMKLRKLCTDLGLENLHEAADGDQALELMKEIQPDLVLSDWNMPNISGIELIKRMRDIPKLKDVPVIFITSEAEKTAIVESMQFGISDYILKPFADASVKEKICAALKVSAAGV